MFTRQRRWIIAKGWHGKQFCDGWHRTSTEKECHAREDRRQSRTDGAGHNGKDERCEGRQPGTQDCMFLLLSVFVFDIDSRANAKHSSNINWTFAIVTGSNRPAGHAGSVQEHDWAENVRVQGSPGQTRSSYRRSGNHLLCLIIIIIISIYHSETFCETLSLSFLNCTGYRA